MANYEADGYDFVRGETQCWFASWGDRKDEWYVRDRVGRPPTTDELRSAYQVVLGLRKPDGTMQFISFLPHERGL